MFLLRKNGATSNIFRVKLRNSSTGQGLTGLDHTSSGLIISTICDNESTATAYTVAGSTIETITTLGTFATPTATKCRFKAVDATNHPGLYEVQIADARYAVASAKVLKVNLSGATNLMDREVTIQLTTADLTDTTYVAANAAQVGGQTASASGTVTFPGTIASTTNITAGTITTTTNLTNDPSGVTTLLSRLSSTRAGYLDVLQYLPSVAAGATNGLAIVGSAMTLAASAVTAIWAAVVDSSGVTTLLSRLTNTRAGYLDNLSGGPVATAAALSNVQTDVSAMSGIASELTVTHGVANTINAKLGAISGSGNNTVLGYFEAIASKDFLTPSDWSGVTYDPATDSLEANAIEALLNAIVDDGESGDTVAARLNAAQVLLDRIGGMLQLDGAGPLYQFTTPALENGPSGSAELTEEDKQDIIDGVVAGVGDGITVTVTPLQIVLTSGRVQNLDLEAHQYTVLGDYIFTVTDSTGAAVNLSGKTVKLVAFSRGPTPGAALISLTGTVSGASHNIVTISGSASNTATARKLNYLIWNTTDNVIYMEGTLDIKPSPSGVV